MTHQATVEYRCRRCGGIVENAPRPITVEVAWLISVVAGPGPEPRATHHCADGGGGIADLIGYRVRVTESE